MSLGVLVSQISETVISSQKNLLQIQASLCVGSVRLPLLALIDSGAEDNFIDKRLAEQLGCELLPLTTPIQANALDGRLIAKVTHYTSPVNLTLSGNHHESISLHLISSPQTPLVLGHPWLKLHNPHIDWALGKIMGWSTHCHSVCLKSALSPVGRAIEQPPYNPDLSLVPSVYHDLREVFNKSRALSLPPHRPYDCAIDLLPGAPLPTSRLYNLSRPEREAMESYITVFGCRHNSSLLLTSGSRILLC